MTSIIRGNDNFDTFGSQGLGSNQTWQNVTANRSLDVTYTNSSGRPIAVIITITGYDSGIVVYLYINDTQILFFKETTANTVQRHSFSFIVPNGSTYKMTGSGGGYSIGQWSELI